MSKNFYIDEKTVRSAFNRASKSYNLSDIVQREVADRLLDRLELLPLEPKCILDIGTRTGYTSEKLAQRYPAAQIFAVESAELLLQQANSALTRICASQERLPFPSQSVDLLFANLAWDWSLDKIQCLREWRRLLKPGGFIIFSAFGPDTLYELRDSFAHVDDQPHVHLFLDMHDVGDALMATQFAEPVMQAEHLTFTYNNLDRLFKDLRETGVTYAEHARRRTLLGKNRFKKMLDQYKHFCTPEKKFPVTFELVYGLGWAKDETLNYLEENGDVAIPLSLIKRS